MSAQTITFYKNLTGGLSNPSKMPGFGYGLPALKSCRVGSMLALVEGTTCHDCYACKGRYMMPNVKDAQDRRFEAIKNPLWVDGMVALIGSKKEKHFRWHDSGDVTSLDHLSKICQIAVRLPDYKFWLPTQEQALVREYLRFHGAFPDNLIIRLSSSKIDGRPPTTKLCTSSVHDKTDAIGHECPAPKQGNKCGDCRACWNKEVKNVSYKHH